MKWNDPHGVLHDIEEERSYQLDKWGTDGVDNRNTPNDYVTYIAHYASKWFPGGFAPYSLEDIEKFRECMLKVATIAVAAMEHADRIDERNFKDWIREDAMSAKDDYSEVLQKMEEEHVRLARGDL